MLSYYDYKWGEKRHISHNNVLFRAYCVEVYRCSYILYIFARSAFTLRINECVEFVIFLELEFLLLVFLNIAEYFRCVMYNLNSALI